MAKIDFKGIEEYAKALGILWKDSENIVKKAVYEGADIVANEIKQGLRSLPVDERVGTEENPIEGVGRIQKEDLIEGFGLSPMENKDGYISTKAGFDGYGSIKTKKYPKGQPLAMLMRSVESGTSFRKKTPVIRKAVMRARKAAEAKMAETVEEEIKKIMK